MRRSKVLVPLLALLVTTASHAQTTTPQQDPEDSGLKRPTVHLSADGEDDNPTLRNSAMLARFGGTAKARVNLFSEAQKQRQLYPNLLPGGSASGGTTWTSIGPTKTNRIQNGVTLHAVNSGRMRTILPHPTDPNTVYLLTSSGGLWKTTNFNLQKPTWVAKTDALLTTSGGAASFGANPETLYVGFGDPFDGTVQAGGVMVKSTNGGDTWSDPVQLQLAPGANAGSIRDVKVDSNGSDEVVLVATETGMYRSANGGASYNRVGGGVFQTCVQGLGCYVNQVWTIVKAKTSWVASVEDAYGIGHIVSSTDRGATWSEVANAGNVYKGAGRTTLAVGAPGDEVVYAFAATSQDGAQLDLFRSADSGQTWVALGLANKKPVNPNDDSPNMDMMQGQAWYNQAVVVDPTDSARNTVYIGGQLASAKSTDGGQTWRIVSNWLALYGQPYVHADFHAATTSQAGGTPRVFFGTDGGLFVSSNAGASWEDSKNEGVVTTLLYSVAGNPANPNWALAGAQDNGTYSRWNDSTIWDQVIGGDGFGTAFSQATRQYGFGSVYYNSIRRFTNLPANMQKKYTVTTKGITREYGNFYTAIGTPTAAVDTTGKVFYTYTQVQIYKTTDGGANWVDIGHSYVPPYAPSGIVEKQPSTGIGASRIFRDTPHGIGVSPVKGTTPEENGQNHIAVVCNSGYVVSTHDGGQTWTQVNLVATVPNWVGYNSAAEWADNSTLYVASENPYSSSARIAKSTDGGKTFSDVTNNLPDVPVTRVLVDPRDKNVVYAATFLGVYRSTDGGSSWSRFGAGLPMVQVYDLYMPPDGSFLRAASYGRGAWDISTK